MTETMSDKKMDHSKCGCGCGEMTTVTQANEPCGCGCECCEDGPPRKKKEDEIAELRTLREAVERRLTELGAA